jgi:hypothetical protein
VAVGAAIVADGAIMVGAAVGAGAAAGAQALKSMVNKTTKPTIFAYMFIPLISSSLNKVYRYVVQGLLYVL